MASPTATGPPQGDGTEPNQHPHTHIKAPRPVDLPLGTGRAGQPAEPSQHPCISHTQTTGARQVDLPHSTGPAGQTDATTQHIYTGNGEVNPCLIALLKPYKVPPDILTLFECTCVGQIAVTFNYSTNETDEPYISLLTSNECKPTSTWMAI